MADEINSIRAILLSLLDKAGLTADLTSAWYQAFAMLVLIISAWILFKICRLVLNSYVVKLVKKTKVHWDDELHQHGFFIRAAHLAPALLIYIVAPVLLIDNSVLLGLVQKATVIYAILVTVSIGSAMLNTLQDVYNASALAQRAPISGFIQVGKLLLSVIALLLIIALLLDRSPLVLLSGLGAVTAILLLIFRDTILGFVAGIQIAANRMVNNGDWIEMPKYGADGNVLEVGLTTVKIQNWDNTISTIPTYNLISDAVKNWRGMQDSQGRRIKRAIHLDIHSIKFCDQAMLDRFANIKCIHSYIDEKERTLAEFNRDARVDGHDLVNSRRLTNIGTLRAYMTAYLQNHPLIQQDMTLMVRQLPPNELGIPIEIYCFSAEKDWVKYEVIQADIFDHLLAMLPVFELRAYQRVSDNPPEPFQAG